MGGLYKEGDDAAGEVGKGDRGGLRWLSGDWGWGSSLKSKMEKNSGKASGLLGGLMEMRALRRNGVDWAVEVWGFRMFESEECKLEDEHGLLPPWILGAIDGSLKLWRKSTTEDEKEEEVNRYLVFEKLRPKMENMG